MKIVFLIIFFNSFDFHCIFSGCFNQHDYNFDVNKMSHPSLHKIKVFLNKCYEVIISVHDVTKNYHVTQNILQIYSCDRTYCNSSVLMRKMVLTS